jgi:Hypoxia induced protein conserved region
MSGTVFTLLMIVLILVVGILFLGLFSMARGGEFNRRYGNVFMRLRVAAQLVAVVLVLLLVFLATRGN